MSSSDHPDPAPNDASVDFDDVSSATFDALEEVLDDVRERHPNTPYLEYVDGWLTALICTRREITEDEWLPALFGCEAHELFASPAEQTRFMMNWLAREAQLRAALEAPVERLDDPRALAPAVFDWRGMVAALTDAQRAEILRDDQPPLALGQSWAAGFMIAVDTFAEEWTLPRDKEIARMMIDAVAAIKNLLPDDAGVPALNLYDENGAPSVSQARWDAYGDALWAVYDLYDFAQSMGPRVAPVRSVKIGRNDPCPCGSGKKYKKCHGA